MVGVINPNATTPLGEQRELALRAAYALQPGDPFPAEGSPPPTSSSSTSSTAGAATATNDHDHVIESGKPNPHPHKLSAGAIGGIVAGGVVFLMLLGALLFYIGRSRALKKEMTWKSSTIRHRSPPSPAGFSLGSGNGAGAIPKAYYAPGINGKSELGNGDERSPTGHLPWGSPGMVERSASQRSSGGVFEVSPTGYFVRSPVTDEEKAAEKGKGWLGMGGVPPLGPYGRQQFEQ